MEDGQLIFILFTIVICTGILASFIKNNLDKNHKETTKTLKELQVLRSDVNAILMHEGLDIYELREFDRKEREGAEAIGEAFDNMREIEEDKI